MKDKEPSQQAIDTTKANIANPRGSAVRFASTKMQRIVAATVVAVMLTTSVSLAFLLNRDEHTLATPSRPITITSVGDFSEIYALIAELNSGSNEYSSNRPGLGDGNTGNESNDSSPDGNISAPGESAPPSNEVGSSDNNRHQAPDFSDTNLQVLGVQEADIVKTDGFHIFAVSDTQISIIAVDGSELELLWQIPRHSANDTRVSNTFEIFITPGRLILMSNVWDEPGRQYSNDSNDSYVWADDWGWGWWGWRQNQGVVAEIYDVSDMSRAPVRVGEVGQSGSYVSSRMIGQTLYLVTNHSNWFGGFDADRPETFVPHLIENGEFRTVRPQDIVHTGEISRVQYTVISGIDTSGSGRIIGTQALMDMGWTVYASHNNMFITATSWLREVEYEESGDGSINDSMIHHGASNGVRYQVTRVTRVALNNGYVSVEAAAEVDGWVLNQWAMDEHDGTFRIITSQRRDYFVTERYFGSTEGMNYWIDQRGRRHISNWEWEIEIAPGIFQSIITESRWEDPSRIYRQINTEVSTNNVFVMDMDLNMIGDIRGLAPGERVFSVRFMREIAFFVTFRDTDPLFAVDFADPTNPIILSELKIPGFSDYLHPFGAGRLFGFGRYVCEETGWWGYLRISMFNTDDLADVYKRHYHDLTGHWWSEANWNHRAILVCERRNLIGFQSDSSYLIYGYCDEEGFFRRGEFTFDEFCQVWGWRGWWWSNMRGLYIGDYFFIITGQQVASFCLDTFEQMDYVRLEEERPPPSWWWNDVNDGWGDVNDNDWWSEERQSLVFANQGITNERLAEMIYTGVIPQDIQHLCLRDNFISDITPLMYLLNIQTLDIGGNQISEISALVYLTNLNYLSIWSNQIHDLTPLSNLYNLQSLMASDNPITDISTLSQLENLESLSVAFTPVDCINGISGLTNMRDLWLTATGVVCLEAISPWRNLSSLWIGFTQITDISPVFNSNALTLINIAHTDICREQLQELREKFHGIRIFEE